MQISGSQPSLSTLRFSFATESQREFLLGKLSEGQTIQARVIDELSTGRWAIRFMGHTLIAESRLSLRPGQIVETRVHELGPPLILSISGRPGSEAAAVKAALRQLGLKDDATNRAILAALIRNGLSVERQEVQSLRDFLAGLGNSALLDDLDELVDRMLFLRSKGIPVTPDTVAAYWSNAPSGALGSLLEGLASLLRKFDKRIPNSAKARIDEILDALSERPGDINPENLRTLLSRLGIDLEGRLANGKSSEGLKTALLQLSTGDLTSVEQDQIGDFIRFLNTLQASSLRGDGSDPLTFQIPLREGGAWTTADIRISRGGANGTVDPSRLSLTVSVTLTVLGTVRIDLTSYDGRHTCGVRVDTQEAHDWIARELGTLGDALTRSGYPVSEVRLRVDTATTEGVEPAGPRIGVDFKA